MQKVFFILTNHHWNDDSGDHDQKADEVEHLPNRRLWSNISPSQDCHNNDHCGSSDALKHRNCERRNTAS